MPSLETIKLSLFIGALCIATIYLTVLLLKKSNRPITKIEDIKLGPRIIVLSLLAILAFITSFTLKSIQLKLLNIALLPLIIYFFEKELEKGKNNE